MLRQIETHRVNPHQDLMRIEVDEDEHTEHLLPNGAKVRTKAYTGSGKYEAFAKWPVQWEPAAKIAFWSSLEDINADQTKPDGAARFGAIRPGVTDEVLLAVVIDHLERKRATEPCAQAALPHLQAALEAFRTE